MQFIGMMGTAVGQQAEDGGFRFFLCFSVLQADVASAAAWTVILAEIMQEDLASAQVFLCDIVAHGLKALRKVTLPVGIDFSGENQVP